DDNTVFMTVRDANDGTGAIVALDLNTGKEKPVWTSKTPGRFIEDMVLSPDGQSFAVTTRSAIARMTVEGTDYRELYPTSDRGMVAWSADGKGIYFLGNDAAGRSQLMRWTEKTGKAETTGLVITQVGHPLAVSPDGSKLIFSDITQASELWKIDNLASILWAK